MTKSIAAAFGGLLAKKETSWAEEMVERWYRDHGSEKIADTPDLRAICRRDVGTHLRAIDFVLSAGHPGLFEEYIAWAGATLKSVGVPVTELASCLTAMQQHLEEQLPAALGQALSPLFESAQARLGTTPLLTPDELNNLQMPTVRSEDYANTAEAIEAHSETLARHIMARHYMRRPQDIPRSNRVHGYRHCLQDILYHLNYLVEALAAESPELFADYVAWAYTCLEGVNISGQELGANLSRIQEVIEAVFPTHLSQPAADMIGAGIGRLHQVVPVPPSFLEENNPLGELPNQYLQALLNGERHTASTLVLNAVEQGASVRDVYLHVFQAVQYEVGRLWQTNQLSVAQEHYCTAATQMIMSQLYPYVFAPEKKQLTLVATCVSGDLHEVGIRMICDFFEMAGWNTFYLGANTPTPSVVQTLIEQKADVLGLSATMTFHISRVIKLIKAVRSNEALAHVKILVGGYPFRVDEDLWKIVEADGFASNANNVVSTAYEMLGLPAPVESLTSS